jgi:glycosyltransferase involved in cell wall biosynthesis
MRILLVTDAWSPQVNGVVRTLQRVRQECEALGHEVEVLSPDQFRTLPCPTYPEIRLALQPGRRIGARLRSFQPDCVHIATEGPLGLAARRRCLKLGLPFTTSYHTRFPEYVSARAPVPLALGYAWMRRFHRPSAGVMVATATIRRELEARGFTNVRDWTRGVDTATYRPDHAPALQLPRPVHLYVGRVAVEKNLEAFLALPLPGSKLVVGDGPELAGLRAKYPDVHFTGAKFGQDLARHYVSGDVFVFPSRTDTFGLVLLEALASGVPVAAFPVPGPLDVIGASGAGALDDDLGRAITRALQIPPERCRAHAQTFSWRSCALQFLANLTPAEAPLLAAAAESRSRRLRSAARRGDGSSGQARGRQESSPLVVSAAPGATARRRRAAR